MITLLLLLPLFLIFSLCLFTLSLWWKALGSLLDANFIGAGVWLCTGIFMINVLNALFNGEPWADYRPIYVFVVVIAVGAEVLKLVLRAKRQRDQT